MKSVVDCQGNFFLASKYLLKSHNQSKTNASCYALQNVRILCVRNCSSIYEDVNLNCKARNLHSKKLFVPFFHQCLDPVLYFGVHGLRHFVPLSGHVGIQGGEQLHLVHKQCPRTLRLIPSLLLTVIFVVS